VVLEAGDGLPAAAGVLFFDEKNSREPMLHHNI
jgi:hypothetical protein